MARFYCASTSSVISKVTYKPGKLAVQLRGNPATYNYYFVPKYVFVEFAAAKSKGAYYNANIKGQYPRKKVK
jgi:hypothetical protein